jgi:hypothetical protein
MNNNNNNQNEVIESFISNAAISGQISHFTTALLNDRRLERAINHAKTLLDNINVCGFIKCGNENNSLKSFTGKGFDRTALKYVQELTGNNNKIIMTSHVLQIKTQDVYLLASIANKTELEQDILVDQLAIFVDILQAWFNNFQSQERVEALHKANNKIHANRLTESIKLLDSANKKLSNSYQHLLQEIVCTLTQNFPTMALEADQEDLIMSLVEQECQKHQSVILEQLQQNQHVSNHLVDAVEQLNSVQQSVPETTINNQTMELF